MSVERTFNIFPLLTLAVIGLAVAKLAGWLTITWWIVFSPWLIMLAITAGVLGITLACAVLAAIFSSKPKGRK